MRNLRTIRYSHTPHLASAPDAPDTISAVCWDVVHDELLYTVGPTASAAKVELLRVKDSQPSVVATWDAPSPNPDLATDRIVSLHHAAETSTSYIVLEGGDIYTVREDESGLAEPVIELVGSIEEGIEAARWSPDEELLVLVTKPGLVLFMGRFLDPISEATMTEDDLKASKHVSVGWGKKETQFQGRGAHALRDPTIPERIDQGLPGPFDADARVCISWRGDGAYVAINAVQKDARRVIRVYSREGVLDSASEPVDGMEAALSWRPSGNLMASIQRKSKQEPASVIFFERNGLRHGQFDLTYAPESVQGPIRLEWNCDSTVLAVSMGNRVQLWTMGNYHWYLKQEIPVSKDAMSRSHLSWHPEKALRLALASATETVFYEATPSLIHGPLSAPHDFGAVAVIDGNQVKITPFRTANMPPPMSMFDLTLPSQVVDAAFASDNAFLAVLCQDSVEVYAWRSRSGRALAPTFVTSYATTTSTLRNLQISASLDKVFVSGLDRNDLSVVVPLLVDAKSASVLQAPSVSLEQIPGFFSYVSHRHYFQNASGEVSTVTETEPGVLTLEPAYLSFPSFTPNFSIALLNHLDDHQTEEEDPMAVGLTRNGALYANTNLIAKNCTSFLVSSTHVIFTTSSHLVKFVHLQPSMQLQVPGDEPEVDERCRSIERGAKLITAMPTNMSIVLQMPRGNVETIFPRALVVSGIRDLIDARNYERAFSVCRSQRVDLNILYDHNPAQFLENVALFLKQVRDPTYIDLFLSSLREEDVSQTMYRDTKPRKLEASSSEATLPATSRDVSKVNLVCDAIRGALDTASHQNIQNIVTTYVCKNPPAIDQGLALIAQQMQLGNQALVEQAVEHICFLVDVNHLYDHALGLYHLELTLLIAQQAQRDPREYVPFIQNLHQMTELRRKFTIDDHLGRYAKALVHLRDLQVFSEEALPYIVKHELYQSALTLYRNQEALRTQVMKAYADYLSSKNKYREAGLAFEYLGLTQEATSAYRSAGISCWSECLAAAQRQENPPITPEAFKELATSLAEALVEAKEYLSAATIYADHLEAIEDAVTCLCKAYRFPDAMRLLSRTQRSDLWSTTFDAAVMEALSTSTDFFHECRTQLRKQVPRILELRRMAVEDPLAFYDGDYAAASAAGADVDFPDDVSVAASRVSTSASFFTRYTGKSGSTGTVGTGVSRATSKNRRREEKKRARGRKGTVYEEEYLVNSVRRLMERVGETKDEVQLLLAALVRRRSLEHARAFEDLVRDVHDLCGDAAQKMFVDPSQSQANETTETTEREGLEDGYVTRGGDAVLQESLEARAKKQEAPVLPKFQSLSLLGDH